LKTSSVKKPRACWNIGAKTITKERLHLPGPDFVDRVCALSDRSPRVLRSLNQILHHGRLARTTTYFAAKAN